jgi:serine/threonine-protein phosphatase 2B regulatory subunit
VISTDDLLMIPELYTNPLARRVVALFDRENEGQVTFLTFIQVLAVFLDRASREDKLKCLFAVWDLDNDGFISEKDLSSVLRMMVGAPAVAAGDDGAPRPPSSSLTNEQLGATVARTFAAADLDGDGRISLHEFSLAMGSWPAAALAVPMRDPQPGDEWLTPEGIARAAALAAAADPSAGGGPGGAGAHAPGVPLV